MSTARVASVRVAYASDCVLIHEITTQVNGVYFFVVESDVGVDRGAAELLDAALVAPWRECVVSTERHARPHPDLLWSAAFAIHAVASSALFHVSSQELDVRAAS